MKVAIIYDRINKWGGAERVLLDLHRIFPQADLFTSVYSPDKAKWASVFHNIYTSPLNKIEIAREAHEYFAWAMPVLFENFDLSQYGLVISVTSESAKGVITSPDQKHICILLTPNRYLWSGYSEYFESRALRMLSYPIVSYLRKWDIKAAHRPDIIISISEEVRKRAINYYNLDSKVVYPAYTKLNNSLIKKSEKKYYLVVSRLVKYKKVDIVIKAFNKLQKRLYIVGVGNDEAYLKSISGDNIHFLGHVPDNQLSHYYSRAQALVFPQIEDYGLTPLESQSVGTPVIAFRGGGALETIIEDKTGIFFDSQSEDSIIEAINRFEKMTFDKETIKRNASKFSFESFRRELLNIINTL